MKHILPGLCVNLPILWYEDVSGTLFTSVDMESWVESEPHCHIWCLKKYTLSLHIHKNSVPSFSDDDDDGEPSHSLSNSFKVKIFNTCFESLWYNFQGCGIADIFLITVK